ncbi:MAG: hydrogenase maturation protease [Candidatus Bipolaricaulaceae bacterium]
MVALGNPDRADDGVAHHVVATLPPREGVEIFSSVKGGMDLALSLLGYERALVIDADPSRAPGEVALFRLGGEGGGGYLHGLGLAEALEIWKRAGMSVPEVWVLAIGVPRDLPFRRGLSPEVAAAVPRAKEVVEKWLAN